MDISATSVAIYRVARISSEHFAVQAISSLNDLGQWRTEGGGVWGVQKIAEFRTQTPQDIRKKGSKILKLPGSQLFYISND